MAPVTNTKVIFKAIPKDWPVIGEHIVYDTSSSIDPEEHPLDGGILIKTLLLSPDPSVRGRMRDPSVKSYAPAFTLGEPIESRGVSVVLRSETEHFKEGDYVVGMIPWASYNVFPSHAKLIAINNENRLPWSYYIGLLGMPGQTAYYGLNKIVNIKEGEKLFVSAASGAVGSVVVQLAKLRGAQVIASAGSDEKIAFLKEIGVDRAVNYKTEDLDQALKEFGELDAYWDGVGGPTLDIALANMKDFGVVAICGLISSYNDGENQYGVKNISAILTKRLRVQGFIVGDLVEAEGGTHAFQEEVGPLVVEGKIKFKEHYTKGIENAGEALLGVLKGDNFGKSVIIVADK
ncbi:hypothetical protein BOTBODRAFT_120227 [Botryobasidium botryosum FD-172 SS1]|uniref:Enoyl reductase (ER) domain-containing protein n=1 Tax=Botryobasidium botryosum (strain FD-172 SS1) TaxID=930990 RepID=A0A067M6V5_BOTB1|nr:hypothetical protein BOTBODRAFT_120227 [Botryobasidium botryosum FD-172 SS1]